MKLASLKSGRDGKLVVVSKNLETCVEAGDVAPTMQAALDNWDDVASKLEKLYQGLNGGTLDGQPFNEEDCASPLPRAYQWADGSAYVNHVELVRKARGAEIPDSFWTDPLMYQGGSDAFLAPRGDIEIEDDAWGIDMEGEIAIITGDVPMGTKEGDAASHIQLVMLVNDVSLRNLIPGELGKGFGFFQSKPSSAFSPVAVTPDELGSAWSGCKLNLPLKVDYNGQPFGRAEAGIDMTFDFARLVEHAAKSRPLSAGTIIGSGTVSNKLDGGPGKPVADGGVGYSCIAEQRMIETIDRGKPDTHFMTFGDTVRIWMDDKDGRSIFGAIDQKVVQYTPPKG